MIIIKKPNKMYKYLGIFYISVPEIISKLRFIH